ncbi:MAG: ABC transporter permease subunit [Planctomycetota bacterium]
MRFLLAVGILFRAHLGKTVLSVRTLICLGLAAMPVAAALLFVWAWDGRHEPPALELAWILHVQTIVPLIALVLGSAAVAEEVEGRTISYLITRPIPRAAILVGRWLALVLVVTLLLAASAWAVFAIFDRIVPAGAARQPAEVRERLVRVIVLGGVVYSAVFAAAGAFLKRPIIVGLGYTFAVEGFLANLPGGNQSLTIQYYLKSCLLAGDPELSRRLMSAREAIDLVSPGEGLRTILGIVLAALVLGAVAITRREYVLPA